MSDIIINNPDWRGRRVAFIGDSITEGVGSERAYHEYMAEWLGITAYNYGVNGAQTDLMLRLAQKLYVEHPDVDAIFVFGGTNDYNHGLPLGDFFDVEYATVNHNGQEVLRRHRIASSNADTFCGRLNALLEYLKRQFPHAQTVLMTPIHRGYARFSDDNVQPDELWSNAQGLFIEDYVNAERRAADIWSVPVIDLYRASGLMPRYAEYSEFFHDAESDNLHPNATGHRRIARTICAALNAIPADFGAGEERQS